MINWYRISWCAVLFIFIYNFTIFLFLISLYYLLNMVNINGIISNNKSIINVIGNILTVYVFISYC